VSWEPVLRHDLTNVARNRISAFASELARLDSSNTSPVELCDRALLCGYLGSADPRAAGEYHKAAELLNAASADVAQDLPSGVINGLSGIGWTIQHLTGILRDHLLIDFDSGDADDPLKELDELVLFRLRQDQWLEPYDLVEGLVGVGVFFLERLPLPTAAEGLGLILRHLETLAEESSLGITWHTPARLLPENQLRECPTGHYNLGVAHGVPGVIFLLGELIAAGIHSARADRLLDGSLRWLLAHQQPAGVLSFYGNWIAPGEGVRVSRLAWCYGDLGIGAILHHVGRRLGRTDVLKCARALLDRCVSRSVQPSEAAICHGALGIAHIFSRIYQTDLDARYRDAANHYYRCGLSLLEDPQSVTAGRSGARAFGSSFLQGSVGIGLALLSAVEPIEPQWDRRLVLSGCSRASLNN
jgi:lantibiotic biosynthesis protein